MTGCGRVGYDPLDRSPTADGAAGDQGGAPSDASLGTGGGGNGGSLVVGMGGAGAGGGSRGTSFTDASTSSGGTPSNDGGARGSLDASSPDASKRDAATSDAGPRPVCGDGVVQPGEACDDRGASKTCNADCTLSSCGDGNLDTLAGETCDNGDHLGACSVTCSTVTCRAGCTCEWYTGHRYMFCPDKITYTAARTACTSVGMRLVRLTSGEEHSYLRLRSQEDAYGKYHIGASDSAVEGKWIWDDGTQFWSGAANGTTVGGNFALWASGEPNNQNGDENCAEVQAIQGFNDSVCDSESKPFICKQYRDPRPTCGDGKVDPGEACDTAKTTTTCDADCSPVVCGDGVVNTAAGEVCDDAGTGQYCRADCKARVCPAGCRCFTSSAVDYALCTTGAAFRDAEVFCGKHGMALASVPSATVDQALRAQAMTSSVSEYWVGGTDLDGEGQWLWLDTTRFWSGAVGGKALGYAHFAATSPAGGSAANCLHVATTGEWTDADCTASFPYICQRVVP